mmetsp:Transcript_46644/g.143838  ORF Transcript_46644/g.143838 Transcript_46644/m.143838 type:complete len:201 (-) Transcript_46644:895-1497(-)
MMRGVVTGRCRRRGRRRRPGALTLRRRGGSCGHVLRRRGARGHGLRLHMPAGTRVLADVACAQLQDCLVTEVERAIAFRGTLLPRFGRLPVELGCARHEQLALGVAVQQLPLRLAQRRLVCVERDAGRQRHLDLLRLQRRPQCRDGGREGACRVPLRLAVLSFLGSAALFLCLGRGRRAECLLPLLQQPGRLAQLVVHRV